ncbi:MAG: thermostable hemolysin [Chromatiaceae bacterium]|nr:thermostable hemolysin [Chromatiaceae bacterium]
MSEHHKHRPTREVPSLVCLEGPLAYARTEAEAFVSAAFRTAYGALITHFMPTLLTLRHDSGRLLAVLGLRNPGSQPLFLEQYLERPIEQVLSAAAATPVDRGALVEVGNFAVGTAGGGRWLITALTAYLYSAGKTWAVFTCGPELRNAFRRLGVDLIELAVADGDCLNDQERQRWGSYYAQQPRVMAANVAHSHQVLAALFDHECALNALWHGALQAGRLAA